MKLTLLPLKLILCSFFILLFSSLGNCQLRGQAKVDSLNILASDESDPLKKADLLVSIFQEYLNLDFNTSYEVAEQTKKLVYENKFTDRYASVHLGLGYALWNKGEYEKAILDFKKCIEYGDVSKSNDAKALGYNGLGLCNMSLGNFSESTKSFYKALSIFEKDKNEAKSAGIYANLGIIYKHTNEFEKAEESLQKAVLLSEKHDQKYILAGSISNLAAVFIEKGEHDKAIPGLIKASEINMEIGNDNFLAVNYQNLANCYEFKNDLDKALEYSNLALELDIKIGNRANEAIVYNNLSSLYGKKNDFRLALEMIFKSDKIAQEIGDIYQHKNNLGQLYQLYKKTGDPDKALSAYEEHIILKDSIYTLEDAENIAEEKIQFEYDKQAALDQLVFDQKIEKQKTFQKYLVLGLFLLLGLLFFAYRAYQIKKKANTIISDKNSQLEKFSKTNENLIFSLSHDIKEPMLGLQLLLKKIKSDDEYLQLAVDSIGDQVSSINGIVNNLLQLKKATVQEKNESTGKAEIIETMDKVIKALQYKLSEKNITLSNTLESTLSGPLPLSSKKLYLVVLNLLSNASKYSFEDGTIEIYAQNEGIYVRDYGSGIDAEVLSKIGNENIDKSDETDISGLGLLLISNILMSSKMELHFEQADGGGTLAGIKMI